MRTLVFPLVLAPLLLAACSASRGPRPPTFRDAVLGFVERSQGQEGGTYQPPDQAALRDVPQALIAFADRKDAQAEQLLVRNGYRSTLLAGDQGVLILPDRVPDGRGWGSFAARPGGLPLAVEVPHPRSDLHSEDIGVALADRVAARYFLVAGARRDRGGGSADVAHQPESLFAQVHDALAQQGVPAVQVHGFAASSSPRNDVVVSPGSTPLSPLAERVADELEAAGFRTCRAWLRDCGKLEARTNAQSAVSATTGAPFVHVEVTRSVRDDPARRAGLVSALAAAVSAR